MWRGLPSGNQRPMQEAQWALAPGFLPDCFHLLTLLWASCLCCLKEPLGGLRFAPSCAPYLSPGVQRSHAQGGLPTAPSLECPPRYFISDLCSLPSQHLLQSGEMFMRLFIIYLCVYYSLLPSCSLVWHVARAESGCGK